MNSLRQLLLIVGFIGLLTACAPVQAPTDVSPASTVAPTGEDNATAEPMPIESVDSAQCDALQSALSAKLGQELTKQADTPCTLVATGTGEDFGNLADAAQAIREVFETDGWTEDESLMADGPTGTAAGFYKDTTVASVNVGWEPAEEANCPTDQPISACELEPSQQNFTISIELVQIA